MRRVAAFALLILLILGSISPNAHATPATQQDDDLATPLVNANNCGDGAPGETRFTIAATGDTFPHENIQAAAEAQSYDWLFDQLRPFLQAADLAYTNFDGAMLEGAGYSGYPAFNYNPKLATALKNTGIDLVSTANNHILDRGPEGLDATMRVFDQNGILYHGTVASNSAAPRPPYLKIPLSHDGITITLGFVSATWGTNGIPDPYNQVNLLYQSNSYGEQGGVRQSVLDAVAQAKRETDLVMVAAHWGFEYQFYPDATQIEAAKRIAAAGADIILGAQPHTLQPIEIITNGERSTLVIYSLANFLASQGAFQAQSFSATSVVLYIGLARRADGLVRVTGYRYLPTIHVDNDTRPAPIPPQGYEDVIAHVRSEMRDPNGVKQIAADPTGLGSWVDVCPRYRFSNTPENAVGGDFATFYATLGGVASVDQNEALAVLGVPLGPVQRNVSGDCRTTTSIVNTPYQRLEWHPENPWPYRIIGTQLGTAVFAQRYGAANVHRADATTISDATFRAFYDRYGGATLFGQPISELQTEGVKVVQYFERARFERIAGADPQAPLIEQVRLGRLSEEYAGIDAQCGLAAMPSTVPLATTLVPHSATQPQTIAAAPRANPLPLWAFFGCLFALIAGVIAGWFTFQRATVPRAAARVRQRKMATQPMTSSHRRSTNNVLHHSVSPDLRDDDELLRDLLNQV